MWEVFFQVLQAFSVTKIKSLEKYNKDLTRKIIVLFEVILQKKA
jgi:hypothetical protein